MKGEKKHQALAPRVIPALAAIVVGLGSWGFARYRPSAPLSEDFYRSLQLFAFESGDLSGRVPWQLEVARLGAPALTVASAAIALAALSRTRLDAWRARHRRGHVIVCGLGTRGTAAALALHTAGYEVVGIEVDPAAQGCTSCHHLRIPIVVGDGRSPDVLAAAGAASATHLLILTPALGPAGEVALSAAALCDTRTGDALTIHLEIADPHLAALLRAVELTDHTASGWRLEELDLAGTGARTALDEHPAWTDPVASAHTVVVGSSPLARALVDELARRWRREAGTPGGLQVTVLDDEAPSAAVAALTAAAPPVTAAFVCLPDESAALAVALTLLRWLPATPVVVPLERADALAQLLRQDAPALHPLSLTHCMFTPDVLLESTALRIARALHDHYRLSAPPDDPAAVAWHRLPPGLQQSNLAQAAHIAEKLRASRRVVVPADGEPADVFDDEEVELLARLEHERWTAEREASGWHLGQRDLGARTTPYLVPWDELDEDAREVDRRFIRILPNVIASAGLVVRRTPVAVRTQPPSTTRR